MHIPDGYLGPATYGTMFGVTLPFWAFASWKLNKTLKARQAPYLALGAAFSFVIMMFNIPVLGGTTGHATGTTLIAILLGPWAAIISVSVALIIQSLLFGDGGITAIGANWFNMAVVEDWRLWYLPAACWDRMPKAKAAVAGGIAHTERMPPPSLRRSARHPATDREVSDR
jgi:cobalt/nickel transport system permease protein